MIRTWCRTKLVKWSKSLFPNNRTKIEELSIRLTEEQKKKIEKEDTELEAHITIEIEELWRRKEAVWKQRLRVS